MRLTALTRLIALTQLTAQGGVTLADVLAILDVPGSVGAYFSAKSAQYYEDAAATIPATLNGVVGAMKSADGAIIAVQATTGNKPFLRRTPTTGIYWLDSNTATATGALVATFGSSLGSSCTVVRAGLTGVTFEENVTIGTTYNIAPPYRFNSDVLIINRALTAAEKALLTQYMGRSVPTLGPESLPNGTFDADVAGWLATSDTTITAVDGKARVAKTSTGLKYAYITPAGMTSGKSYLMRASAYSDGISSPGITYTTSAPPGFGSLSLGEQTLQRVSVVTANYFFLYLSSSISAPAYCDFDNLSVKEIL